MYSHICYLFLVLRFLWFLHFYFDPNSVDGCQSLISLIERLGVGAIKAAQWYSNMYHFKYSDDERPLLFTFLEHFRSQNKMFPLTVEEKHQILAALPTIQEINTLPFASGSIAQVHLCYDNGGHAFVLKRRHPFVAQEIHHFRWMVSWFRFSKSYPEIQQFIRLLENQTDLLQEAQKMQQYQEWYHKDHHVFRIPTVFHADADMILMEYVPFTEQGDDVKDSENIICFLSWILDQVLYLPWYHGDLHYGNWGVCEEGRYIALYDFGMVMESEPVRPFLVAILERKKVECYDHLCMCLETSIPQEVFETAWQVLEENSFVVTLVVVQQFMRIALSMQKFPWGGMRLFTLLIGLQTVDKIPHIQGIVPLESMKHQYSILRSKKCLPRLQRFLWNHFSPPSHRKSKDEET